MSKKQWIQLTNFTFYPGNPRKISDVMLTRLKKSIKEFSDTVEIGGKGD